MKYEFRLILSGVDEITPALADALYEATGGDIEFSSRDGEAWLDVYREANSLQEAILEAINEVNQSGAHVKVQRVETVESITVDVINRGLQTASS